MTPIERLLSELIDDEEHRATYHDISTPMMRLVALLHDSKPLNEAIGSGDAQRIAAAKEPFEAIVTELRAITAELAPSLERAMAERGWPEAQRVDLRQFVAKTLDFYTQFIGRLNNPAQLFDSIGKPIGDA
ncbi:hypothetical protein [Polyangium mundeleinium]|uniref:Uncharacterized protein n=1 Tax=Polyangium mundeleinium TaxID=2995306 RepID=A0ABT5ELA9_9BACT|nr:hypothetical protein [Polyangium mundeleinium]MDC0742603.1 hypothetical protein [Polyangium mundeleinium]